MERYTASTFPGLHRLMYGLLFPAVLGSIFVVFIADDLFRMEVYPRFVFGIVFLFHWSATFVLNTSEEAERGYTLLEFAANMGLIIAMYQAFVSLPSYSSPKPSYAMFYFWVMIIGGIYLFEDILRSLVEPDRAIHRRFDLVDAGLMLLGLSFFIAHQYIPVVHGSQMFAYLFIAGTIIASVSAILLYR